MNDPWKEWVWHITKTKRIILRKWTGKYTYWSLIFVTRPVEE